MNPQVRLVSINSLELHPVADIYPPIDPSDYASFLAHICKHGVIVPIRLLAGTSQVIDGKERLRAAREAGYGCVPVMDAPATASDDPAAYIDSQNFYRKHYTISEQAAITADKYRLAAENA
jgi:ParB-like chromosome segregation protein Spo0J